MANGENFTTNTLAPFARIEALSTACLFIRHVGTFQVGALDHSIFKRRTHD